MRGLLHARSSLIFGLLVPAAAFAQQKMVSAAAPDMAADRVAALSELPEGPSTILGGAIRDVDPVLDRFTLNIVGGKPMKILYDQRTKVFVDGKGIPLRALPAAPHASVQTTLDGTSVFAISIHILSDAPSGEYRGAVLSYRPEKGELDVIRSAERTPVRLHVTPTTQFAREGQGASNPAGVQNLQPGALISVQFQPDGNGQGTAESIKFLATPGEQFVFAGNILALNTLNGTLVLVDPRDQATYEIAFDSSRSAGMQNLQRGQKVRVTAIYNGTRYLAQSVSTY